MSGHRPTPTYGRADLGGLLSAQPVIGFAATTDPARARAFYGFALGLAMMEETAEAMVFDAGGTMLRVQKVRGFVPLPHPIVGWRVDDIVLAARGLAARGVACELRSGPLPDESGPWAGPPGLRVLWFRDPDGNILALMQVPPD